MVVALLFLAACGSGNTSSGSNGTGSAGSSSGTSSSDNSSSSGNSSSSQEPPYEVVMGYPVLGEVPADIDEVEAAINEITLEKINATVKLSRIPIGQWFQQKNLILASNEKYDLILTDFQSYSAAVAQNQFLELDELLEQYGQDIRAALGANLDVARINGSIYATPVKGFNEAGTALMMRKDLLDKYGIDASSIKGTNDLDAVYATIKANEPDMTVLAPSNSTMPMTSVIDWLNVDMLTDGLGVLPNDATDMKVVNYYELPEYVEALKKLRSWYQAGYIPKDAVNNKANPQDLMRNGDSFSHYEGYTVFLAAQLSATTGRELVSIMMQEPVLTTQNVIGLMWAIPRNNTKNPQKAMEMLNLFYTDKDIINLINYGIEGKHYTKVDDQVIRLNENSGYTMNQAFMFGNRYLTYVLEGEDPALRDEDKVLGESMQRSRALGFLPNLEAVQTEVAAVNNVLEQYRTALETGSVDPDKVHPEFISKLKAAGIDTIIAEKQRQLDEWLAQK